jgi:hypothetical protein
MGVTQLESESVIAHIVEAMLPRFSDRKLGLLIGVDMDIWDNGYGKDGNTRERKELHVRRRLYFLFNRPSNYTKVLFWEPLKDSKGWDCSPAGMYGASNIQEWHLESDHDSCWRDAVGSKLTDVYFKSCGIFEGRKITGETLRPCDLSQFTTFTNDPKYMCLEVCEQKDKQAVRFGDESRTFNVHMKPIELSELEAKKGNNGYAGGLLVKGSEDPRHHVCS